MIARHVVIGLVALTALSSSHALAQAVPCRNLEQPFTPLSDDAGIRLIVQDCAEIPGAQPAMLIVQLYGASWRNGEANPRPLSGMAIQVWLLRADGTAMDQRGSKPWKQPAAVGLSNLGSVTEIMSFSFEHTDPKELVGVVVSVNKKLFVREIK